MQTADANGISIAYETLGDPSEQPLVLIMGIGAQMCLWPDDLCERLVERGFYVIRFDNRDVGLSDKVTGARAPDIRTIFKNAFLKRPVEAPYDLSDMASDVAGLLDALEIERAHVLGVSMGGMIAQTFAIDHPDRLRSLTSIMSTPGGRRNSLSHPRALKALFKSPPKTREEAIERNVEFFRTVGGRLPRDEGAIRHRAGVAWDRGVHPAGVLRQLAAIAASGDRRPALRRVRAPTVVMHGTLDPLIPPWAGWSTARAIPQARLRMIRGMGHDLPNAVFQPIVDEVSGLAGL